MLSILSIPNLATEVSQPLATWTHPEPLLIASASNVLVTFLNTLDDLYKHHPLELHIRRLKPWAFSSSSSSTVASNGQRLILGHPKPQKLAEMKFWDFSHRSRDKTCSDKLGGIWGEILVGRSAQWMKHENAPKISPNSSPNSSPRISPGQKNLSPQFRSGECQANDSYSIATLLSSNTSQSFDRKVLHVIGPMREWPNLTSASAPTATAWPPQYHHQIHSCPPPDPQIYKTDVPCIFQGSNDALHLVFLSIFAASSEEAWQKKTCNQVSLGGWGLGSECRGDK